VVFEEGVEVPLALGLQISDLGEFALLVRLNKLDECAVATANPDHEVIVLDNFGLELTSAKQVVFA